LKPGTGIRLRHSFYYCVVCLLACPGTTHAFYQWQDGDNNVEMRGVIRLFGIGYDAPEDQIFYEDGGGLGEVARLIMESQLGSRLGFELNAVQSHIPSSIAVGVANLGAPLEVERSAALEWSFSDEDFARLAIDRLNARWSYQRLDLTLGRQPVNLATTFYFTPNDFFAPFAAQSFFRVYKLGVDAARAEIRLGELSQLSLISVLGYERDTDSDTGWSDSPDSGRTSNLARISTVRGDFEWALLGGGVRETDILGGSLQGELFDWLGVRAEGHHASPDDPDKDSYNELAVGLEHRWENSLELRLEQFYHGNGADAVEDYQVSPTLGLTESIYLARRYTALGASYEFTPLLNGQMVAVYNWTDHSYLVSFNALYSLSDESELAVTVGIPGGDEPEGKAIGSEFGLYPYSLNIELRAYF